MLRRFLITALILMTAAAAATAAHAKGQDIVKVNKNIEIQKEMTANEVVAVRGNVTISGKVESNVVVVGGDCILKPGAEVGGQVVVVGGEIQKDPSAVIKGRITQVYMPHFIPSAINILKGGWIALWATISLLVLLGFLGLALLLSALIPENLGTAVALLERSFTNALLFGIFWVIMVIPIAILLAISIIGIILIPLEILLIVLALIIGYIASAIFIGKSVLLALKKAPVPFVDAILGILILFMIGFVPIIGPIMKTFFLIAGFGAVIATRFGTAK